MRLFHFLQRFRLNEVKVWANFWPLRMLLSGKTPCCFYFTLLFQLLHHLVCLGPKIVLSGPLSEACSSTDGVVDHFLSHLSSSFCCLSVSPFDELANSGKALASYPSLLGEPPLDVPLQEPHIRCKLSFAFLNTAEVELVQILGPLCRLSLQLLPTNWSDRIFALGWQKLELQYLQHLPF